MKNDLDEKIEDEVKKVRNGEIHVENIIVSFKDYDCFFSRKYCFKKEGENTDNSLPSETLPSVLSENSEGLREYRLNGYCGLYELYKRENEDNPEETDKEFKGKIWLFVSCRFGKHFLLQMLERFKDYLTKYDKKNKALISEDLELKCFKFIEIEGELVETNGENIKKVVTLIKNIKKNDTEFFRYSIKMDLLFELYARIIAEDVFKDAGWDMWEHWSLGKKEELEKKQKKLPGKFQIGSDKSGLHISGEIYPDIVLEKDDKYIILDAKYKDPSRPDRARDDRLQLLAYAQAFDAHIIGHIFPQSDFKYGKINTRRGDDYYYMQFGCYEKDDEYVTLIKGIKEQWQIMMNAMNTQKKK